MTPRSFIRIALLGILGLFVTVGCRQEVAAAPEAEAAWKTDYAAALTQSQKEGKPVLLDFTGSDWCPPCMLLHKRIFSTKTFADYAAKNLILVKVDFPKRKPLPPEQEQKNNALAEKFGIETFPTILIVDSMGRPIGGMQGYDGSSPEGYVASLQQILKEKPFLKR